MRKITQDAIRAFNNNYKFKRGNTEVRIFGYGTNVTQLMLHGNVIAYKDNSGTSINACGFLTSTTKERLNGLHGVHIYQKDWNWYLNGELWDGSRIKIN